MDRFDHAIRAGVIGGIVLVVLSLIGSVINFCGLSLILALLALLTALGTGALAAQFAHRRMGGMTEVAVLSGFAGVIAGIIDGLVHIAISLVRPGFNSYSLLGFIGKETFTLLWSPIQLIFYVVVIAVLAVIGGIIYGALKAD